MIYSRQSLPQDYYIYAYIRSQDSCAAPKGTPYYIGKGSGRRAWVKHKINLPEDPAYIVILESNLTEIGAFALERRMIQWYGRIDNNTGILRNRTEGGEQPPNRLGVKMSKESIRKQIETKVKNGTCASSPDVIKKQLSTKKENGTLSASPETRSKQLETRKKNGTLGASPETRKKQWETRKRNGENPITVKKRAMSLKGIPRTKEWRENLSKASRETNHARGKHWFTNGVESILSFTCPEGYSPGRIRVTEK